MNPHEQSKEISEAWWDGYQNGERDQNRNWIKLGAGFALHTNSYWLRVIRFARYKLQGGYNHCDWCEWWRWWPKR